jgi:hypothetical protein
MTWDDCIPYWNSCLLTGGDGMEAVSDYLPDGKCASSPACHHPETILLSNCYENTCQVANGPGPAAIVILSRFARCYATE